MKQKNGEFTKKLVESSLMVAFATVLSMLTLLKMPYGGSVTVASMLPILIVAYRHGVGMGLGSGFVYAAVQQLLGLDNLSYVTGWQSVLAVIILDYVLAFTVIGIGGIFKNRVGGNKAKQGRKQSAELAMGMILVCILRYLCHTVAGATVWAGLSIPTEAALLYSIGYNATYMIPETVVNVTAALWIGNAIDFSKDLPLPLSRDVRDAFEEYAFSYAMSLLSKLIFIITVIADTLIVFAHLQDGESGKFTFEHVEQINFTALIIVSVVGILLSTVCYVLSKTLPRKKDN